MKDTKNMVQADEIERELDRALAKLMQMEVMGDEFRHLLEIVENIHKDHRRSEHKAKTSIKILIAPREEKLFTTPR